MEKFQSWSDARNRLATSYSSDADRRKVFSNLTIRNKITGASLFVVTLLVIISGSAILSFRNNGDKLAQLQSELQRMAEVARPLAELAAAMQISVTQVQQYVTDVSATRGLDGLDKGLSEAGKNAKEFHDRYAEAMAIVSKFENTELRSALTAARDEFDPYFEIGKKMAAAYIEDGTAAGNVLMPEFDDRADKLRLILRRVVEKARSLADASDRDSRATVNDLVNGASFDLRLALSFSTLGLALMLAIVAALQGGVIGPINALALSMSNVASGKMDTVVPNTETRDEIGEMARAVEVFRQDAISRLRLTREIQIMSEFNEWLQSAKSESELYGMIASVMGQFISSSTGSLYIYANSRDVLECVKTWNGTQIVETMHPDDCWGLRRGRTYVYDNGGDGIHFSCSHTTPDGSNEYCCIPILAHGETVGLLHLERRDTGGCDTETSRFSFAEERRMGSACAEQISLAIANIKLREQLRDQSIRDSLTGLYNRRYMMETCQREFARARRMGQQVSLLSIDVDYFKKFNDNHGHDAGDTVLRAVGECLRSTFREEDVPCRFGGEEFVVVMPGTEFGVAERRAEDLRKNIESLVVRYADGKLPRITISIGVASFPNMGDNPIAVMKAADHALYAAKSAGRNCVQLADVQISMTDHDDSRVVESCESVRDKTKCCSESEGVSHQHEVI
jgi:diguanylate cyclase (GGDEF)-like protein